MVTVSVDVDVELDDVLEEAVRNCNEDEVLDALARWNTRMAQESGDATEKAFAVDAAKRLHELAKWFRENQP